MTHRANSSEIRQVRATVSTCLSKGTNLSAVLGCTVDPEDRFGVLGRPAGRLQCCRWAPLFMVQLFRAPNTAPLGFDVDVLIQQITGMSHRRPPR